MNRLLSLLTLGLALALAACGSVSRNDRERGARASSTASNWNTPQAKLGGATPALAHALRAKLLEKIAWVHRTAQPPLGNDGDNDEPGDEDKDNSRDAGTGPGSIDPYVDYLPASANQAYHDEDDQEPVQAGRAATPQELHAVAAIVERYYAAASMGDGAAACSLMARPFVKAAPIDYGKLGASYLHGAKTCASVLARQFEHEHRHRGEAVQVTQVRIQGMSAMAFLGAKKMRASVIHLTREGSAWTIDQLAAAPLL